MVLDDWIDGTGYTPDQVLDALRNGMGGMGMAASPSPMMSSMSGMSMPAASPSPSKTGMDGMSSGPSPRSGVLDGRAQRAEPGPVRRP